MKRERARERDRERERQKERERETQRDRDTEREGGNRKFSSFVLNGALFPMGLGQ
jgi:hypothetical protein